MHTDRKKPDVTTAIILEKRVTTKADKHPVKLRITYKRKRKYYQLIEDETTLKGEHYTIDEFEALYNEETRNKQPYKKTRLKFDAVEKRAIEIIDDVLNQFSFEAFEREYKNDKTKDEDIQAYFETKATELDKEHKIQTATLYRSTFKSLMQFDNDISFEKITSSYLKKYEKWMLENNHTYTTIGMYLRNLRHIINRAIADNVINEYPFSKNKEVEKSKYSIPEANNFKKALTISDIELLINHRPEKKNEKQALDYWLFSYLCNGMNMADIANLKYKNIKENNIEFIRQKTKDTSKKINIIRVLIIPEIQEIIDDLGNTDKEPENYIFPIFKAEFSELEKHNRLKQHIKNTNKYIRRVAKDVGINENITTYWARHSYSTILKRSGAPIEFISEQLGHQSTQVTKNYLDSFEDEQRAKYSASLLPNKNKAE